MAIEVLKVELKSVSDASGLENGICQGRIGADGLGAVPLQAIFFDQPPGCCGDFSQIPVFFRDIKVDADGGRE